MAPALRHRTVRRIAFLFAGSVLLEWAAGIALMVVVYAATGSGLATAGMLVCTQLVPNAIVAAFAGRFDRCAVRPLLVAAIAAQAAGALVIAIVGYGPTLYAAALLIGAGASVARSQLRTGIARVDRGDGELLRSGNALFGVVRGPAGLIGPAMAGVSVAVLGAAETMALVGGLQLALAVSALLVPVLAPHQRVREIPSVAGASSVREPSLRPAVPVGVLLAAAAVTLCVFSVDEPVLLAYADQALGAGASGYSAIFVAWGAGLLLGGLMFTRLLAVPMLTVFAVGLGLNVLGHVGMLIAPSLAIALVGAVVGGIGNGMDWSALSTAIQEAAPAGREGSVAARLESLATVGAGLGIVAGGLFADLAGARATLAIPVIGGLLLLLVGGIYLRGARRWRGIPSLPTPSLSPAIQGGTS